MREFETINGKDIITFNKTWFDGESVYFDWDTPWNGDVPITGNDGSQNGIMMDKNSEVNVFIPELSHTIPFNYVK